jgi:hypothetical protein
MAAATETRYPSDQLTASAVGALTSSDTLDVPGTNIVPFFRIHSCASQSSRRFRIGTPFTCTDNAERMLTRYPGDQDTLNTVGETARTGYWGR